MSVKFELDFSEVEALEEKFKKIPENVENIINSYLHLEGVEITKREIRSYMPVSKQKRLSSKHAKLSNSLRHKPFNLGFEIMPYPRFNYLVFPDRALGTSKGKNPKEFMEKGLDKSTEEIIRNLNERIDQKIKEALQ